jgi:phenylacetate-CoA ligase
LPLIRYELDDRVRMLVEPNPDPWTGRRIADPEGRVDGAFVYDVGVEVELHLFRSALGRQILEYQVRQTPAGAAIAVQTSARLDTAALRRELFHGLTTLGLARPRVTIDVVQELERAASTGKLRRFVPLARARR